MSRRAISGRGSAAPSRSPWSKAAAHGTASPSGRRSPAARSPRASARRSSTTPTEAAAMADPAAPERHSPLEQILPWSLPEGAVEIAEHGFLRQIGLRRREAQTAYFAGLPLPLEFNRVSVMG